MYGMEIYDLKHPCDLNRPPMNWKMLKVQAREKPSPSFDKVEYQNINSPHQFQTHKRYGGSIDFGMESFT